MNERQATLHGALRRAFRAATSEYREHLAHLGLTARQAAVILAVEATPGLGLTAVAQAVGADQATISELVDRLVERRLFTRETDPTDRRRTCLRLTPAAIAVADDIRQARAAMEKRLEGVLGAEKARMLLELLNDLTERLGQEGRKVID